MSDSEDDSVVVPFRERNDLAPGRPVDKGIGARIQNLRLSRGIDVSALAAQLEISRAQYDAIELGELRAPVDLLSLIARHAGVSIFWFFGTESRPAPRP